MELVIFGCVVVAMLLAGVFVLATALQRLRVRAMALGEADREQSAVLAGLPEPVVLLAADGRVVRAYGPAAPSLDHLRRFLAGPHGPRARAAIAGTLADGASATRSSRTLDLGPGPDERRCELRMSRYNAGTVLAYLHDVTEQRRFDRRMLDEVAKAQQRMGSDLHDGLCQQLTGLLLLAQALEGGARRGESVGLADIARLREHLAASAVEARQLSQSLYPVVLRQHGLVDALRQMCDATGALHGIRCECRTELRAALLAGSAIHLYRIAQEAVANAVRHARATAITVTLTRADGALVLTIADDGVGMPAAPVPGGMGVHSMSHRAEAIGAWLTWTPGASGGTVVRCVLPEAAEDGGGEGTEEDGTVVRRAAPAGDADDRTVVRRRPGGGGDAEGEG
jgi:signal transduction histidine kinase